MIDRPTPETERIKGALHTNWNDLMNHARKLERERDAARAVANELSDIASKHLSFLLAITPTKPNEKHEKETGKVIEALKRWKKL